MNYKTLHFFSLISWVVGTTRNDVMNEVERYCQDTYDYERQNLDREHQNKLYSKDRIIQKQKDEIAELSDIQYILIERLAKETGKRITLKYKHSESKEKANQEKKEDEKTEKKEDEKRDNKQKDQTRRRYKY